MQILIALPLFVGSRTMVADSAPLVQQADGAAWERYEDRRPRPIVPEPSAYGAGMLLAVLAVIVGRRVAWIRCVGHR